MMKNLKIISLVTIGIGLSLGLLWLGYKDSIPSPHLNNSGPVRIVKSDWNSIKKIKESGNYEVEISSKQLHYFDGDFWQKIDTNFIQTAQGFEMTKAPF